MDSAGAPTAVVTPSRDTPTSSGVTDVGVPALPLEDVDGAADVDEGSVVDEHPDRITRPATAALSVRSGYLGMRSNLCTDSRFADPRASFRS